MPSSVGGRQLSAAASVPSSQDTQITRASSRNGPFSKWYSITLAEGKSNPPRLMNTEDLTPTVKSFLSGKGAAEVWEFLKNAREEMGDLHIQVNRLGYALHHYVQDMDPELLEEIDEDKFEEIQWDELMEPLSKMHEAHITKMENTWKRILKQWDDDWVDIIGADILPESWSEHALRQMAVLAELTDVNTAREPLRTELRSRMATKGKSNDNHLRKQDIENVIKQLTEAAENAVVTVGKRKPRKALEMGDKVKSSNTRSSAQLLTTDIHTTRPSRDHSTQYQTTI